MKKTWKCHTCKKQKDEGKDPGIQCNLCTEWIGLECTSYTKEIYKIITEQNIEVNLLCRDCKKTLPELRSLLDIAKQQQKLTIDVVNHEARIKQLEADLTTQKQERTEEKKVYEDIVTRLEALENKTVDTKAVETIAQRCFNAVDFPPLAVADVQKDQRETREKLEAVLKSQQDYQEESKKREATQNSLIVYGIEEKEDSKDDQMKADYKSIKELYTSRVEIQTTDLSQISRVGQQKANQIRPIKITFTNADKKLQVLRNNKNLILHGEDDEDCGHNWCQEEDNHKHIYVTTDKTKLQREEEKKLRTELKARKETETDLIIRNGKIVKKQVNHARWSEIRQDGF